MAGYINNLAVGTVLRGKKYDYEIAKVLGQGSFGITYLAKIKIQGNLGSIDSTMYIAVKEFFMHEVNGRDGYTVTSGNQSGLFDKYKQKFIKEAVKLSNLSHPNIVKVIGSFTGNNTVYYCMEHITGGSLDELIAKRGGLTEAEALSYTRQIASALEFMHQRNMLHLDIKPSNIMLRADGTPVLIDFGLSKQYYENGIPESSTTVGGGTPGYAPIEQSNYDGDTSKGLPATMDIYALGATLYKMLVGVRPPQASEILNDGFDEHVFADHQICPATQALITHMMAPMRKQRLQTIAAVIAEMDAMIPAPPAKSVPIPATAVSEATMMAEATLPDETTEPAQVIENPERTAKPKPQPKSKSKRQRTKKTPVQKAPEPPKQPLAPQPTPFPPPTQYVFDDDDDEEERQPPVGRLLGCFALIIMFPIIFAILKDLITGHETTPENVQQPDTYNEVVWDEKMIEAFSKNIDQLLPANQDSVASIIQNP